MKTYTIFGLFILLLLSGCSSSQWVDNSYYDDDLYYKPKSEPVAVDDSYAPITQDKQLRKEDRKEFNQLKSEYNQSDLAVEDNRNFSQIQTDYMGLLANDSIAQMDTLVYYNEETGYWVDGFEGSGMDQDYAERLIKFHGPFNGIPYWSPLYNDMVYFNNWDWNVYVDGNYAYAFPTWSNPWYNDYRFNDGYNNPWRGNFSMSWGWGYPSYGYGYYDPWYSPWNNPWYGGFYGHHHCYPGYGGGYYPGGYYPGGGSGGIAQKRTYKPRGGQATTVRPGGSQTFNTSRTASNRNSIKSNTYSTPTRESYSRGSTQVTYNKNNQRTITNTTSGKTYTRVGRQSGDTKSNSSSTSRASGNTRRSYTPSYSNSRSNSPRSSYNRSSSYTRPSSTRSSGSSSRTSTSRSSSSRSYSGTSVKSSNSRSSSSTGSSKQSSYSPSRSSGSSSKNSYSPSRSSSNSGSSSYSGSSSRSSGSSSRSSGSSGGGTSRSGGGRR